MTFRIIFSIGMILFTTTSVCFIVILAKYQKKKKIEYGDDERWQNIIVQTNLVLKEYYDIFVLIILTGYSVVLMTDCQLNMSLRRILELAFCIVLLRYPIEYFSLRHYDKVM